MSTTVMSPSESKTDLFKISKTKSSSKKKNVPEQPDAISHILSVIDGASARANTSSDSKRKHRSRKWSKNQCGDGLEMNLSYSGSSNPKTGHYEGLPLLKQRLGYFWEKKMFTDVLFKVGIEESPVEAHRAILASGAESFQKLLYGPEATFSDGKFILHAKEFSVSAFKAFIKAFYTNEFSICLTLPIALEVFHATKKYQVGFLQDKILDHIRSSVTVSNVFEALQVSTTSLELTFIAPMCWKIIECQTKKVLEYHLDSMDSTTLTRILERDQLSLKETELHQYLVKWGSFQCKQRGIKVSGKTKRQFIEPLLKYIRFPTMTLMDLDDCVIPSRTMEGKEIQAIQAYINGSDISKLKQYLPYKSTKRQFLEVNAAGEIVVTQPSEPEPNSTAATFPSNKSTSDSVVTQGKKKKRVPSTRSSGSGHGKLSSTDRATTTVNDSKKSSIH